MFEGRRRGVWVGVGVGNGDGDGNGDDDDFAVAFVLNHCFCVPEELLGEERVAPGDL
jgi:hypothetical protein